MLVSDKQGKIRYESVLHSRSIESSTNWSEPDRCFMQRALNLAGRSETDEVPVGAVLVRGENLLGEGVNRPLETFDPTSHAEIEALRQASFRERNYRLAGSTLYVTLEPCVMCAGAIVNARVERIVFAARDLRFGAIRSKFQLADSMLLNHRVVVQEGLLAAEAAELLTTFFEKRRGRL